MKVIMQKQLPADEVRFVDTIFRQLLDVNFKMPEKVTIKVETVSTWFEHSVDMSSVPLAQYRWSLLYDALIVVSNKLQNLLEDLPADRKFPVAVTIFSEDEKDG